MKNKLYILEGADGTGKTTLANKILEETKGHLLHASYKKDWNIKEYHDDIFSSALILLKYQDVIIDRWAVSEEVYSEAYRGGKSYSADDYIIGILSKNSIYDYSNIKFIYCCNDKIVKNHERNKTIRKEMFDDISPVVNEYTKYINNTNINWIEYDFTKNDLDLFVKGIINE